MTPWERRARQAVILAGNGEDAVAASVEPQFDTVAGMVGVLIIAAGPDEAIHDVAGFAATLVGWCGRS